MNVLLLLQDPPLQSYVFLVSVRDSFSVFPLMYNLDNFEKNWSCFFTGGWVESSSWGLSAVFLMIRLRFGVGGKNSTQVKRPFRCISSGVT